MTPDRNRRTDLLDRLMLARYRRLGPRYIDWYLRLVNVFSAVTIAVNVVLFMVYVVDRPDVAWTSAGLVAAWNLVFLEVVGFRVLSRTAGPLRDWLAGSRGPEATRAAWHVARQLTFLLGRQAFLLGFFGVALPAVIYLRIEHGITVEQTAFAILGVISFGTWLLFLGVLVGEAWLRWPRRDVTAHLDGFSDDEREVRTPIARKLLVMFPLVSVLTGSFVAVSATAGGAATGDLVLMLLLTVLFTFTTSGRLAWLTTRSVVAPLQDLVDVTRRVRQGHVGDRAAITSNDEIGRLAVGMNDMLDTLEAADAEVRASSVRLMRAADVERRRVERAIRDGASGRLIQIERTLSDLVGANDDVVASGVFATVEELLATLEELRNLGQELHPTVLSSDGLHVALAQLAERSRLAVDLDVTSDRFNERVEATAWVVVSELIAGIARDESAQRARVTINGDDDRLRINVRDDGAGTSVAAGTGFMAVRDRVEAAGGELVVKASGAGGRLISTTLPLSFATAAAG